MIILFTVSFVNAGLVQDYTFDLDKSEGYTPMNGVLFGEPDLTGHGGTSIYLDGNTAHLVLENVMVEGDWTINYYVKRADTTGNDYVVDFAEPTKGNLHRITQRFDTLVYDNNYRVGTGDNELTSDTPIKDNNQPYMITVSSCKDTMKMYVNTQLQDSTYDKRELLATTRVIGSRYSIQPSTSFRGWVDNFQVYDECLEQEEIMDIYEGQQEEIIQENVTQTNTTTVNSCEDYELKLNNIENKLNQNSVKIDFIYDKMVAIMEAFTQ